MAKPKSYFGKVDDWAVERAKSIWKNLQTNHLWQRMLKNTLATSVAIIIALVPAIVRVYGKATYLAPIATVFGHPGRRFGMMAEALVLAILGTCVGTAWSMLGLYLSSLVYGNNEPAAYAIKGAFLAVALLFHGFLRSHTPRLFIFVLLLIIVAVVSLTGTSHVVSATAVTSLLYPILTAISFSLLVNIFVFPEFSSSFLGITTIETLGETVGALQEAGNYFIDISDPENLSQTSSVQKEQSLRSENATAPQETKSKSRRSPWYKHRSPEAAMKSEKNSKEKEPPSKPSRLKSLTDYKAKLRLKLANCKAAQQECNFELTWAVLPPRDLKPISVSHMKSLVASTIALIGACESKYALMGDGDDAKLAKKESKSTPPPPIRIVDADITQPLSSSNPCPDESDGGSDSVLERREKYRKKSVQKSKSSFQQEKDHLEMVKPRREIEFGNEELLKHLVESVSRPLMDLQGKVDQSVDVVTSCLAYCYDVSKLPSGARPPSGIELEEIDIRIEVLVEAMANFDANSALALERAVTLHELEEAQVDIMPRMEIFLISSFLLNFRQAAQHILSMLHHARVIVEKRHSRHDRRRLYAPRINWRKWLASGGEDDMLALPESGRKDAREGKKDDDDLDDSVSQNSGETLLRNDVESGVKGSSVAKGPMEADQSLKSQPQSRSKSLRLDLRLRNGLADVLEFLGASEDVAYAVKLAFAVFLVTWPAFLSKWNTWYSLNRGLWAALQLILITEVALGTSIVTFVLRAVGTTIGCLWGLAAYQAGNGNRVVCVVILIIGIIPSTYIQLGSKYVKAGMVSIISMSVIALATVNITVPGTATENFLKRLIAFLIGGAVALIVEAGLFPVKARDRLVESLAASIRQIMEMEGCLAYGIETETNVNVHSLEVQNRFKHAKGKAEGALAAAETFLPFCANEPRLKGSFKALALVYTEMLYVLHAIVDRMDNILHLRHQYGSGVLEELNTQVFPYRRNVAGSVTLVLFAAHEALTTKFPLPQFLPSARLAHLRMVNRVREVVLAKAPANIEKYEEAERSDVDMAMVKQVVRQKFLSWNAASSGQIEVIEYLEELVDLVKLLVGANEFRSGLLTRPTFKDYVDRADQTLQSRRSRTTQLRDTRQEENDEIGDIPHQPLKEESSRLGTTRRRLTQSRSHNRGATGVQDPTDEEEFQRLKEIDDEEIPRSLQRVKSRRIEEEKLRLEKSRSGEGRARKERVSNTQ